MYIMEIFLTGMSLLIFKPNPESLSDPDFPSLPDEIHNRTRQAAHEARDIYFDMKRRRSSRTVSPAEIAAHNGQRQRLSIHCTELD